MLELDGVTKDAATEFDNAIRSIVNRKNGKLIAGDFPGVQSPNVREYLMDPNRGAQRIVFSKLMDKDKWRKLGYPDVGAARFATSDENLLTTPTYNSGYMIGRMDRENPVDLNPNHPHGSYPVALRGDYVGSVADMPHKDELFPTFTNYYDTVKNPKRSNYVMGKYKAYSGEDAFQILTEPELRYWSDLTDATKNRRATGGRVGYADGGDPDIDAALTTARAEQQPVYSDQEMDAARKYAYDQAVSNRTMGQYAGDVANNLSGMANVGLFHDIIPGAVQSAQQAFTAPARAYEAGAAGQLFSDDQMINEALNMAGMVTLGAGAIPAQANALRMGFTGAKALTADQAAIRKAQRMLKAGAPGEDIHGATGYFPEPLTGKMMRYEPPQGYSIDLNRIANARPNEVMMLEDLVKDRSVSDAYPNIMPRTFVNMRRTVNGMRDHGASVDIPKFYKGKPMYPANMALGDLSHSAYQLDGGVEGAVVHEINHLMSAEDNLRSGTPGAVIPRAVVDRYMNEIKGMNNQGRTQEALNLFDERNAFVDQYNVDPQVGRHLLYAHDTGEAMARLAARLHMNPNIANDYPLNHLDVKPEYLLDLKRTHPTKPQYDYVGDMGRPKEMLDYFYGPEGTPIIREYIKGNSRMLREDGGRTMGDDFIEQALGAARKV